MKNEAEDDQGQNVAPYRDWAPTWLRGLIAFTAGCLLLDMGLRSLDVRIEWFIGLDTFSFSWVLAMIPLPVLVGVVVGLIYGFGGKYLAHFPPVLVLGWCYYESMSHFPLPDGTKLMPWQFWAFFLILQMEFCALGAVFGEVLHHRLRGWDNRIKYGADSEYLCDQEEIMLKKLN
ncbi:hypothetical protein [Mariprofundus ferrooxydans]|uniref:hypothetical protein n=1 Tax=Mariprofundus ferrooxydans TaxID=314344 RepID=UPI00142F41E0|nr:hypothetical protein [Mariprofundus ferrooxydans]